MCAIEIVKDLSSKLPDKELTTRILQEAHQSGVIVMSAGMYGNVLRLLSPLVITDAQLEEGLDVLVEAIRTCVGRDRVL
ncbi:4-aminobutyrate aminotransferase GabT [compost metagenome]